MLALFLRDVGALREDADVLAVGGGLTRSRSSGWPTASAAWSRPTSTARASSPAARRRARCSTTRRLRARTRTARTTSTCAGWTRASSSSRTRVRRGVLAVVDRALRRARRHRPGGRRDRPGAAARRARFIVTECLVGRHPLDWPLVNTAIRRADAGAPLPGRDAAQPPDRRLHARRAAARIVEPSGLRLMQPLELERVARDASTTRRACIPTAGSSLPPAAGIRTSSCAATARPGRRSACRWRRPPERVHVALNLVYLVPGGDRRHGGLCPRADPAAGRARPGCG